MEKKYFDMLMEGLEDIVAFQNGDTSRARVIEVEVPDPIRTYKAEDVVRTRKELNLTQSAFAFAMGVSKGPYAGPFLAFGRRKEAP